MPDHYRDFEHLRRHEVEGEDFIVEILPRRSRILVMAPHGGGIEPHTAHLATEIAGGIFSCYLFKGIKARGNRRLHLTSHRFDEPRALRAAGGADWVAAVHGERNPAAAYTMAGGLDRMLAQAVADRLMDAGFEIRSPRGPLAAVHPLNICNRGASGKGVQIEVSAGLRAELGRRPLDRARWTGAVRTALLERETA